MKPWTELAQRTQVARLARLAREALGSWALTQPTLKPLGHGENATFRVDAREGRFLLRVHRHGYHSDAAIRSELAFLGFLRDLGHDVPTPIPTRNGDLLVHHGREDVPHTRRVTLLRWQTGRMHYNRPKPPQARRVGVLMAGLHAAGELFEPPAGFERPPLDLDHILRGGFGNIDAIPWLTDEQRQLIAATEATLRGQLASLPPLAPRVIHADLHLGNILFEDGRAKAIDFDDMGVGTPALDIATTWNSLRFREATEGEPGALCAAFLDGYASVGSLPDHLDERIAVWAMVREMTILAWLADRIDVADLVEHRAPVTERVITRCRTFVAA
ncbi:MAG: hypothetical protein EP330_11670 [Deltaproteobacteria bacterium]|nr:MAG: hypothetical protein EP330_11670 [Deltaproteobacteria bacterium]